MKENLTLKIKDLALLKQNPEQYMEKQLYATKTHDGTSMSPMRSNIKNFINKLGNDPFRRVIAYDSTGEKPVEYLTNYVNVNISPGDLKATGETGMHIIMNTNFDAEQVVDDEYDHDYGINRAEAEQLTLTNDDGEHLVRSITMVDGKSTMTLIANNNFGPDDYDDFLDIIENAHATSDEEYMSRYGDKLEKCNVKLRFQKNSDVEIEPPDKWTNARYKDVEQVIDYVDVFEVMDKDPHNYIFDTVGASGDTGWYNFYRPKY